MKLFLGGETVVNSAEIIGIFDIENTSLSKDTRAFLAVSQKSGRVVNVSEEMPKSFIVAHSKRKGEVVYIAQMSAATLKKRAALMKINKIT